MDNNKFPNNSKLVFEGVLFDVYHWEQKMFDGTTKTFEGLRRMPSVQVIATTSEKKLIILKEIQPQNEDWGYSLIGGGCNSYDEDPKECALRELLEETGMKPNKIEEFYVSHPGGKINWPTYYYIAQDCIEVQEQQLDGGEKIEVLTTDFETFCEHCEDSSFRNQYFSNILFRILHTPEKLEQLKEKLQLK